MRTDVELWKTEAELAQCFRTWGVSDWTVDYNMPVKGRDAVASRYYTRDEAAVTVRWRQRNGMPVVLSMRNHDRPRDNARVLFLAIDSIRLNEKRGIDFNTMRSAYMQLAAPEGADPYGLVGITPGMTREEALSAYRAKARETHPDVGGSDERHGPRQRRVAPGPGSGGVVVIARCPATECRAGVIPERRSGTRCLCCDGRGWIAVAT